MTAKQQRASLGILTVAVAVAAVVWTIGSAASLSHTFDEPHHVATGIEWWQFGTYRWWTENPPLPKVVNALAPYLAGMRLPAAPASFKSPPFQLLREHPPRILRVTSRQVQPGARRVVRLAQGLRTGGADRRHAAPLLPSRALTRYSPQTQIEVESM